MTRRSVAATRLRKKHVMLDAMRATDARAQRGVRDVAVTLIPKIRMKKMHTVGTSVLHCFSRRR
tara:strand:- start:238 stop:429 length:192 start_codon:yes stop_codon:yes gene_type:complete